MKADSIATLIFLAAIGFGLWLFSEGLPFQNEVTVYHAFCTGERKQGKCSLKEQTARPATYKAMVDQQTVVYWYGDNDPPRRLQRCAVRNAKNWACKLNTSVEDDHEWQMLDGTFVEAGAPAWRFPNLFYQVPKWRWWLIWLDERLS